MTDMAALMANGTEPEEKKNNALVQSSQLRNAQEYPFLNTIGVVTVAGIYLDSRHRDNPYSVQKWFLGSWEASKPL